MSNNCFLNDISTACDEIDRCLKVAYTNQRPVYIAIPSNMVDMKVTSTRLEKPIDLSVVPNDEASQKEVIDRVLTMISKAKVQ